jgi:hypothetical protein
VPPTKKTQARKKVPRGREKGTGAITTGYTAKNATYGTASNYAAGDPSTYTPATATAALKGGYTKVDGKLYKGTFAGVNATPYENNALGLDTGFTGLGGKKRAFSVGPGGISYAPGREYGGARKPQEGRGRGKPHDKVLGGVTNESIASSAQTDATVAGSFAEADLTRTGTAAAQGKAYEAMFGTDAGTVLHAEAVPSVAQSAGEAAAAGGTKKKTPKKKPGKKPTAAQRKKRASKK